MRRSIVCLSAGIVAGLIGMLSLTSAQSRVSHDLLDHAAPEFTHVTQSDWLNSAPLSLSEMRGQVVLVDFWTFGCWNCFRSFPWLNGLQAQFADRPVKIIGVHTPEFEHERDREKILAKIAEFELDHPVMVDNDSSYWRAMHNRYWPAYYLIDKNGIIRHVYVGETHAGSSQARKIATAIGRLAKEPFPHE